jgi:hypothetical protein
MEKYILKYVGDGTSDFAPFKLVLIKEWDRTVYLDGLGYIKDKGFIKFGEGITTWGSITKREKSKNALIGVTFHLDYYNYGKSEYAGFVVENKPDIYEFVDCKTVSITLTYIVRKEILTIYRIRKTLKNLKERLSNYKEFKKIIESLALGYVLYKNIRAYPIKINSFDYEEFYYYLYKNDLKGILDQETYLKITKIDEEINKINNGIIKDANYILDLAKRFVEAQKIETINN